MAIEKRQFLFGMDQDSDDRFIQPGFTRKNLNVRVGSSVSDGNGTGENISGNVLIPNLGLPEGNNRVVGSSWYKKKDLSYFFVWNENEDHGIYEYNHVSSHISTVMIAKVLAFTELGLITGINIVEFNDDNDFLYWTALSINPSKINIQKSKISFSDTPENGYTLPIKKEIIDAIKYPPLFPVTVKYKRDEDQKVNFLEDKILQFKARYIYDDYEKSAFSPISIQAIPSVDCSGVAKDNVIILTVPKGGELVRRVEIAVRFSNISDFFKIIDQPIEEYSKNTDTGDYEYTFKNDSNYNVLNKAESDNLFDRVPQIAGAQEFIAGNRIAYGDITENYDNVPIKVELDTTFDEEVKIENENTISGQIIISNKNLTGEYRNYQPIWSPDNVNPVFGGFSSNSYEKQISKYQQSIPLGGFVVYLTGTDFYAVSEQVLGTGGRQTGTSNTYSGANNKDRDVIQDNIEGDSSGTAGDGRFTASRMWSKWEITNVPDGTYILRVASHFTTQEDLNSGLRNYQKTSTYIYRFIDPEKNTFFVKEFEVTVEGGSIIEDITIDISDLSDPRSSHESTAISGYFVDQEDKSDVPSSISELLAEQRINNATISVKFFNTLVGFTVDKELQYINTDHNGFFYGSSTDFGVNSLEAQVIQINSGNFSSTQFSSYNFKSTGIPSPGDLVPQEEAIIGVFSNKSTDITNYSRTNISFRIMSDDDRGVKNIYCVLSGGGINQTDAQGAVSFITYASTDKRSESGSILFYTENRACIASFEPKSLSWNIIIGKDNKNNEDFLNLEDVIYKIIDKQLGSFLKRGGSYTLGIVYYDRANRSGLVNVSSESNLLIPFYTEKINNEEISSTAPNVNWEIKHAPPSWATHYQWVRTKNTSISRYLQWCPKKVEYLNDQGSVSNSTNATQISLDISNLSSEYVAVHPDSILSYDYTKGDRVRFIKDANGDLFEDYIDVKITSFATGKIIIENRASIPSLTAGCLIEIYTPKLETELDVYYEIGECFEVIKIEANILGEIRTLYAHQGLTQNQDPISPSSNPAKGTFRSGDTFYRSRTIPLEPGDIKIVKIDSVRFSDFYESSVSNIGRPNLENQDASLVHRPTTIYYSQRFIPETNINGLNTFYSPSFETYDRKNGSIRKLFSINNRLDCYQELKVSKILVQENVVFDQFDKGTVGVSESVLSNPSVPYQGEYGTMNPESFAEEGGRRYFFDVRNGAVLRLSNDGLTVISDKQMHAYFESKSNFYSSFDQVPEIWGVFDENHDEYVLNFGSISREEGFSPEDLALVSSQAEVVKETKNGLEYTFIIGYSENDDGVPTEFEIVRDVSNGVYVINSTAGSIDLDRQKILTIPSETVAFSERTGYWDSFYSYLPECMCRVGIDFLSFKNGKTFLHNSNKLRNNFYGIRFPSELWVVFNQGPSNNKVFNALGIESTTIWEAREILTDSGQKSQLIESDFQDDQGQGLIFDSKENIHYAALLQDENTPNVEYPLINGDDMRDVSILFKLTKDTDYLERIFAANINFALSQRSNK